MLFLMLAYHIARQGKTLVNLYKNDFGEENLDKINVKYLKCSISKRKILANHPLFSSLPNEIICDALTHNR